MKRLMLCAVVLAGGTDAPAETIKLQLEGVKCDQCTEDIIAAIERVPTARLKEKPTKTRPVAVLDLDLARADVGAVGQAVAAVDTPHKTEYPPAALLVLDAPGLTDANVKNLQADLKGVKGVNALQSSGSVTKKEIAVRLDASGAARLADIEKALADYTKKE